jgi:hypothetical protein
MDARHKAGHDELIGRKKIFTALSDCRPAIRPTDKSPEPPMFEIIAVIAAVLAAAIAAVLDAPPPHRIVIKLDFFAPFEGHNTAEFTFVPQGDSTNVTWRMHGPAPLMSKLMQVFMNLDNMVGKDFVTGLANLKRVTEK